MASSSTDAEETSSEETTDSQDDTGFACRGLPRGVTRQWTLLSRSLDSLLPVEVMLGRTQRESASAASGPTSDLEESQAGPRINASRPALLPGSLGEEFPWVTNRTRRRRWMHRSFWSNFSMAFWLGFWVAFWSLPCYSFFCLRLVFGETALLRSFSHGAWPHTWCNVSIIGGNSSNISDDLHLDVQSCEPVGSQDGSHQLQYTQMFGSSSAPYNGKSCGFLVGLRYKGHSRRFWVGNGRHGQFPELDEIPSKLVEPVNGTDPDDGAFAEECQQQCQMDVKCAKWTFWIQSPSIGGICYFYAATARMSGYVRDWRSYYGGFCRAELAKPFECGSEMFGRMRNIAPWNQVPDIVAWNQTMKAEWGTDLRSDLWCGLLPNAYISSWPNVVQMVIFSINRGTGTTMMLSWQSVCGTSCACLNMFVMMYIYPHGGRGHVCQEIELLPNATCVQGEIVRDDPAYSELFCWLDTFGVLFLFLISGSQSNTIKFGMSWHCLFMMNFMNPAIGVRNGSLQSGIAGVYYDDPSVAIFITSLFGGFLAVLATIVPYPQLNARMAFNDLDSQTASIGQIWRESVAYFCGTQRSAKRFQIETKIDTLVSIHRNVRANLEDAWWESVVLGRREDTRQLLLTMRGNLRDMLDMLDAVKTCIIQEDFQGKHQDFCDPLRPIMEAMVGEALTLAELCVSSAWKSQEPEHVTQALKRSVGKVRRLQRELVAAYQRNYFPTSMGHDLLDESILVFALSFTARKSADLACLVITSRQHALQQGGKTGVVRSLSRALQLWSVLLRGLWTGFVSTWSPSVLLKCGHIKFAVRNFTAITLCFVMGVHFHGFVFTPYSPIMAFTLSLLITKSKNSAFMTNVQRLLGVTLGNVLPILILAALSHFHCNTFARDVAHFFAIWIYIGVFMFMYLTSPQWSLVGCYIAAFGVYPLLVPCSKSMGNDVFKTRYSEIGQVTLAIVVQMVIDMILMRRTPGDMAVHQIARIGEAMALATKSIFESDLPGIQAATEEARRQLVRAEPLLTEVDPKLQVMQGFATPFKRDLYSSAMDIMGHMLADLNLLIIAVKDWTPNESVMKPGEQAGVAPREENNLEDSPLEGISRIATWPEMFDQVRSLRSLQLPSPARSYLNLVRQNSLDTLPGKGVLIALCGPSFAESLQKEILVSVDTIVRALPAILAHRSEEPILEPSVLELERLHLSLEAVHFQLVSSARSAFVDERSQRRRASDEQLEPWFCLR
ncbi:unnamed protein product [Polarella glacialis]|uniref:Uncharacterized protein n=1 Tax=Polarella glacialis TaxID=89957 RepID=A0A813L2E0_POLGL|nr:unnamed protein product [Polarella glacialis]